VHLFTLSFVINVTGYFCIEFSKTSFYHSIFAINSTCFSRINRDKCALL